MESGTCQDSLINEGIIARAAAIIALGKAGHRDAITQLIQVLENKSEVEWLRGCAAIALGPQR
jgi:HEAT repeat protein